MVGLYFNTKNMSAILKALQNRKSVELKSEVIELSVLTDMGRAMSQLEKTETETKKASQELNSLRGKMNQDISFLKSNIEKFEKATKELGIEAKDSKVFQDSLKVLDNAEKLKDKIK